MSKTPSSGPLGFARDFLGRLRFPQLFALAAILLVIDLVVPDPIPYLDEIFLAVVTLLLAQFKERRGDGAKDVTPGS